LATCEDCTAEVELIRAASRAYATALVDTARIVRALPQPPRRSARRAFGGRVQQIAAAIGIVAIGAFSAVAVRDWAHKPTAPSVAAVPATSAGTRLAANTPAAGPPAHQAVRAPSAASVDSPAPAAAPVTVAHGRPAMSFGGGLSDLSDD